MFFASIPPHKMIIIAEMFQQNLRTYLNSPHSRESARADKIGIFIGLSSWHFEAG